MLNYDGVVFLSAMSILILIQIGVVLWCRCKGPDNSLDGYFVSHKSISVAPLTLSCLATQLGGVAIIGTAEAAYSHGWMSISYALGLSIGCVFLSLGIGSCFNRLNISTIPEIFEKIYGSKLCRVLSSILMVYSMLVILSSLALSMRKSFYAMGFLNDTFFLVFWLGMITYTVWGGFKAIIVSDSVMSIFILGLLAIIAFLLFRDYSFVTVLHADISMSSFKDFRSWIFTPALFVIIGQDMGQRCFSAKDSKTVSLATFFAAVLLLATTIVPVSLGVLSSELSNHMLGYEIMERITALFSSEISGLFMCVVVLAIVSTADSVLCSVSSNITLDLLKSRKFAQLCTFLVGVSALVSSYFVEGVINSLIKGYLIAISSIAVPVLIGGLLPKIWHDKASAVFSFFAGFCFVVYLTEASDIWYIADYIGRDIFPILISAIVYFMSLLCSKIYNFCNRTFPR